MKEQLGDILIKEKKCYGYIINSKEEISKKKVSLYYSGHRRRDYAIATTGTPLQKELVSPFSKAFTHSSRNSVDYHFAFYHHVISLGHLIHRSRSKDTIFKKLAPFAEFTPWDGDILFLNNRRSKEIKIPHDSNWGYFKDTRRADSCVPNLPPLLTPLYEVHMRHEVPTLDSSNDMVVAIDVGANLNAKSAWQYTLPKEIEFSNNHPVVSSNPQKENPLLIFLAQSKDDETQSSLLFLNANTGAEKGIHAFRGKVHNSAPLVFDEYIMIPRHKEGLIIFQLM